VDGGVAKSVLDASADDIADVVVPTQLLLSLMLSMLVHSLRWLCCCAC
jgi:hypothetical protein